MASQHATNVASVTNNTMINAAGDMAASMLGDDAVRSTLVSRNITVLGRRTSVRLEPEMWTALRDIAKRERCRIHDVCSLIQLRKNPNTSLTAAIRVFLMLYYRAATTEQGHIRAGHGDFNTMINRAQATPESLHMTKRVRTKKTTPFTSASAAQTPVFHSMQGL